MLGNEKTAPTGRYLNVRDGKIVRLEADGKLHDYSYIEGYIRGIRQAERTFGGGEIAKYWYIDIEDEEGEGYSLGSPYASGVFVSLVMYLYGVSDRLRDSLVKIEPYRHNKFDRVRCWLDGVRISWYDPDKLPDVEGADNSRRMTFIDVCVNEINKKLNPEKYAIKH